MIIVIQNISYHLNLAGKSQQEVEAESCSVRWIRVTSIALASIFIILYEVIMFRLFEFSFHDLVKQRVIISEDDDLGFFILVYFYKNQSVFSTDHYPKVQL